MRSLWVAWKRTAQRGMPRRERWPRRLAGALALALLLCLAAGIGQVRAAAPAIGGGGALLIAAPDYRGVVGGPPGASVTVEGGNWTPYSSVSLTVTSSSASCYGISVGSYPTDKSGSFTAGFLWPLQANHVGAYYVCGTQANYGSSLSENTFSVLASRPPSLAVSSSSVVAGQTVTITGSNWVPGPQTVELKIVPCNSICTDPPVAVIELVTTSKGTFSQQLTISAGAVTGNYYAQATNSEAWLSAAPAGPIQVTGQAAPGTPVPGVSPTTTATRTTQNPNGAATTTAPPSQTSTALKDALLAAGLGVVVLLVLIGGLAFFIGRSRGPDVPQPSKPAKEGDLPNAPPGAAGRATWRAANPVSVAALQPPGALVLAQRYQDEEPLDEDVLMAADEDELIDSENDDEYPWDEQIPPPPPEPPDHDRRSAPRPRPAAPGVQSYPQADANFRQPPNSRAADNPAQFMPPRRSERPRPPRDPWEQ
jgi:hypothetical protein